MLPLSFPWGAVLQWHHEAGVNSLSSITQSLPPSFSLSLRSCRPHALVSSPSSSSSPCTAPLLCCPVTSTGCGFGKATTEKKQNTKHKKMHFLQHQQRRSNAFKLFSVVCLTHNTLIIFLFLHVSHNSMFMSYRLVQNNRKSSSGFRFLTSSSDTSFIRDNGGKTAKTKSFVLVRLHKDNKYDANCWQKSQDHRWKNKMFLWECETTKLRWNITLLLLL